MPAALTHQYRRIATIELPVEIDSLVDTPIFAFGNWYLSTYNGIFKSTDDGMSWTLMQAAETAPWELDTRLHFNGTALMIVMRNTSTGEKRMRRSLDGVTFGSLVTIGTMPFALARMVANPAGIVIVFVSGSTTAFRSTDHGATWAAMTLPTSLNRYYDGAWNGTVFVISEEPVAGSASVLRSTTGATGTWTSVATPSPDAGLFFIDGTDIYVTTRLGGTVLKSNNNAVSFGTGNLFTDSSTVHFVVDNGFAFALKYPRQIYLCRLPLASSSNDGEIPLYVDWESGNYELMSFGIRSDTHRMLATEQNYLEPGRVHILDWLPIQVVQVDASGDYPITGGYAFLEIDTSRRQTFNLEGLPTLSPGQVEAYVSRVPFDETVDIWMLDDYLWFADSAEDIDVTGGLGPTTYAYVPTYGAEDYTLRITLGPQVSFWTDHINSEEV